MKQKFIVSSAFIASLLLVITSCKKPVLATPSVAQPQNHWGQYLHDPLLHKLSERLLAQNLDLRIAKERILEAMALERGLRSSLFPNLSLGASAARTNDRVGSSAVNSTKRVGVNTSWDLDLFGTARNAADSARSTVVAREMQLADVQNAVMSLMASVLAQWRASSATCIFLQRLIDLSQQELAIVQKQFEHGLVNQSEVEQLSAQLLITQGQLKLSFSAVDVARFQVEKLLGMKEGEADLPTDASYRDWHPTQVEGLLQINISSITNRPDIRAARAQMLAEQSNLSASESMIWPSITLGNFFGASSIINAVVATNPVWALTAAVTMPLMDFGSIKSKIDVANSGAIQAELAYESSIVNALEETKSALSDYLAAANALGQQKLSVERLGKVVHLAHKRFSAGFSNIREELAAQKALQQSEIDKIQRQAETRYAAIRLCKAMYVTP